MRILHRSVASTILKCFNNFHICHFFPFSHLFIVYSIQLDQINDNFCDCPDCSDEYGTPESRNSQFWCLNRGSKSELISPSKVRDGICGLPLQPSIICLYTVTFYT